MRFFQPHDTSLSITQQAGSVSSVAPPSADGEWAGVHVKNLDVIDMEPLRAEILAFLERCVMAYRRPYLDSKGECPGPGLRPSRDQEPRRTSGVSALATTNVR